MPAIIKRIFDICPGDTVSNKNNSYTQYNLSCTMMYSNCIVLAAPHEWLMTQRGYEYNGHGSVTRGGLTCRHWSVQTTCV